jgi:competence protein ComFB
VTFPGLRVVCCADWQTGIAPYGVPRLAGRPEVFSPPVMHNALEEVVGEVFDQLARARAEFCSCTQCRDDVITHALNQARPRYISGSLIGSAVTRVALSHEQARAELAVLVLDAMRRVTARPRHLRRLREPETAPG